MAKNKALLLDRDGVINIDHGYLYKTQAVDFLPGVFNVLRCAEALGFKLIIVTNQSGIGRGYFGNNDFQRVQRYINHCCFLQGIRISKVYHCPHAPDISPSCDCRKPRAGMINKAAHEFSLDLSASWLVGDKLSDIQAGLSAGVGNLALMSSLDVSNDLSRLLRNLTEDAGPEQSYKKSVRPHLVQSHAVLCQLMNTKQHQVT